MLLDIFVQYQLYQRHRNDLLLNVYHETSALRARIEKELNGNLLLVQGLADYISYQPNLSKRDFEQYSQGMMFKSDLIRIVSAAPDYVVKYVYPTVGYNGLIGQDYRLSESRWQDIKNISSTGKMILTGPVDLAEGETGFVGEAPVFIRSNEYFWGMVSATFDANLMLEHAGLDEVSDLEISVRGFDGQDAESSVIYGNDDLFDPDKEAVIMEVVLSSGKWQIAAIPENGWDVVPPESPLLHMVMLLLVISISFSIYKVITKRSEIEMVRSKLSEAQSIAHLGNWSLDISNNRLFWSEEVYRIFGVREDTFKPTLDKFYVLVHPQDRNDVQDTFKKAMETGELFALDHRIVRPDGEVRYISKQGKFIYDEDGRPLRSYGTIHDITERKQIEHKLRESKNRFEHVTNKLSRQFVFFSHTIDGKFIRLSEGFSYLGFGSPEEGIGRKWTELFNFSPDSLALATEKIASVIAGKVESTEYEIQFTTPDGQERFMVVYVYLAYDYGLEENVFEGVVYDITERKAHEEKLKILSRAIENAPVSVVITDTKGDINYVNPYFCKESGYSNEEVLGQNSRILKSGVHDDKFYADMWETISSGETWRGEILNKKKDGTFYWEAASISPVYNSVGEIVSYVGVKEEISDKKELEQLKSDVDLIMRHDLKTPLNGIIGFPGLLQMDDNLTDNQRELLRTIENSGKKMLTMIDMSLDMFKMETGRYEYFPLRIDALGVARQVVANSGSQISASKVDVKVLVDGESDYAEKLLVWGEEKLIYSLLSGLLTNAIEASPFGEDIIIAFEQGDDITISVCNKGVVPLPIRERFFHKYVTQGKDNGTGLGTYSAKLMTEAMHYEIEMRTFDELDETRIIITIPRERFDKRDGY